MNDVIKIHYWDRSRKAWVNIDLPPEVDCLVVHVPTPVEDGEDREEIKLDINTDTIQISHLTDDGYEILAGYSYDDLIHEAELG